MVVPAVEGINLFKIAGRSISGWILSFKMNADSPARQPFCSQLEERLLLWPDCHPQVASYARGDIGPQFAKTCRLPKHVQANMAPARSLKAISTASGAFPGSSAISPFSPRCSLLLCLPDQYRQHRNDGICGGSLLSGAYLHRELAPALPGFLLPANRSSSVLTTVLRCFNLQPSTRYALNSPLHRLLGHGGAARRTSSGIPATCTWLFPCWCWLSLQCRSPFLPRCAGHRWSRTWLTGQRALGARFWDDGLLLVLNGVHLVLGLIIFPGECRGR
jgi:hypothetical protein